MEAQALLNEIIRKSEGSLDTLIFFSFLTLFIFVALYSISKL